jgi:hypothetical protein
MRRWSGQEAAQLGEVLTRIAREDESTHRSDTPPVSSEKLLQAQWCFSALCEELNISKRQMDVLRLTLPVTPGADPSHTEYRKLLLYVSVLLRARRRLVLVVEAIEGREGVVKAVNGCQSRVVLHDLQGKLRGASTDCLDAIEALWKEAPWLEGAKEGFVYKHVDYEQKVRYELQILEGSAKDGAGEQRGEQRVEGEVDTYVDYLGLLPQT